jgi:hypothetical protein
MTLFFTPLGAPVIWHVIFHGKLSAFYCNSNWNVALSSQLHFDCSITFET